MSWLWTDISHVGAATRTSSGAATAGIHVGSYRDGQLIVHVVGMAGVGAFLRPIWQSSRGGTFWGDFVKGATMTATGVTIVVPASGQGIGNWARMRWTQSATGVKFDAAFVLK